MRDIFLNSSTNDIEFINGELNMGTNAVDLLRQRIHVTLNAWVGEWKLNTLFGIPYRQSIFTKGVTKSTVDAIFLAKINEFDEVQQIIAFESEYDKARRTYNIVRLIVRVEDETVVLFNPFKPDNVTYQPSPIVITSICE